MAFPHTWSDFFWITGGPNSGGSTPGAPTDGPVYFPNVPSQGYGPGLVFCTDIEAHGSNLSGSGATGTANTHIGTGNWFNGWADMRTSGGGFTGLIRNIVPTGVTATGNWFMGQTYDLSNGYWFTGVINNQSSVGGGATSVPWAIFVGTAAGGYMVGQGPAYIPDDMVRNQFGAGVFAGAPYNRLVFQGSANRLLILATGSETVNGTQRARPQFQSLNLSTNTWGALTKINPGVDTDLYFIAAIKDHNDLVHVFYRDMSGWGSGWGYLYHTTIDTSDNVGAIGTVDRLALDPRYGRMPIGFGCAWPTYGSGGVVLPYVTQTVSSFGTSSAGCARLAYYPSDGVTTKPVIVNMPMLNGSDISVFNLGQIDTNPAAPGPGWSVYGTPGCLANNNGSLYGFHVAADWSAANDGVWMFRYTGGDFFTAPAWTGCQQYYRRTWSRAGTCWANYNPSSFQLGLAITDTDYNLWYGITPDPSGTPYSTHVMPAAFRHLNDDPSLASYPAPIFGDCATDVGVARGRSWAAIIG